MPDVAAEGHAPRSAGWGVNVPSNGIGRYEMRAVPGPRLSAIGSLEKKLAPTSRTDAADQVVGEDRLAADRVGERHLVQDVGHALDGLALELHRDDRLPAPGEQGGAVGRDRVREAASTGRTEIWSMTERRTIVRWPASSSADPSQFIGPKMRSDSAFQLTWLAATGEVDSRRGAGRDVVEPDRRRADDDGGGLERLRGAVGHACPGGGRRPAAGRRRPRVPWRWPPRGSCACEPNADGEVADAGRVALEDVQRGRRARAEDVAVHRRREERVARDPDLVGRPRRAEDAEVGLDGGRGRCPGAPRTIPTSWTITSEPRSRPPMPNEPTVNTTISTGTVIHAHSRRSSRRRTR